MKLGKYLALILLLGFVEGKSQHLFQFSQSALEPFLYNPAFAGTGFGLNASALTRRQWVGVDGAPTSIALMVHQPVRKIGGGLGVGVISDRIGPISTSRFKGAYAYQIRTGLNYLSVGIAPEIWQLGWRSEWTAVDGVDMDPAIGRAGTSGVAFDASFGLLWNTPGYYASVAVNHLLASAVPETGVAFTRTVLLQAGTQFETDRVRNVVWVPTTLLKFDLQNTSGITVDLSVLCEIHDVYFVGLGLRPGDAAIAYTGYRFYTNSGIFRVGYSYDMTTSGLNRISNGSHELGLKYNLVPENNRNSKGYRNVRFL